MDLRNVIRNARKRAARANESFDEAEERRQIRNSSLRERRQTETVEEREVRLNFRRQRKTQGLAVEVDVNEHDCGSLTYHCNFCQALYWKEEENSKKKITRCCHDGKVSLPSLCEAPNILIDLMSGDSAEAKNFRQHIRSYNAAFASMGAEIKSP